MQDTHIEYIESRSNTTFFVVKKQKERSRLEYLEHSISHWRGCLFITYPLVWICDDNRPTVRD